MRADLLLDAIAEQEGLTPDDEAVTKEIESFAASEAQSPERVRALYERPDARSALKVRLGRRRALERVVSTARIVPELTTGEVAVENQSR